MFHRAAQTTRSAFPNIKKAIAMTSNKISSEGATSRHYSGAPVLLNKHADDLLDFLKKQGAMDLDHGPIHIQATRYSPGEKEKPSNTTSSEEDNSKIIHFQRHGQGYHNFVYAVLSDAGAPVNDVYDPDPNNNPFVRPEMVDAPLTELGREQCLDRRSQATELAPEVLIVSPLHRAIQTAQITFRDFREKIPFIAHEGCREEMGLLLCNKRRPLSDTIKEFPSIDFSIMAETAADEDNLWDPEKRECPKAQSKRIYEFCADFLRQRPEKEIVVVGHSAWLFNMCNTVLDCGQEDDLRSWFGTSEIRSMRFTFSNKAEK
jgi:broad specificity phosphatase PhoE